MRALVLSLVLAVPLAAQVAEGDRFYATRAQGSRHGRAQAAPVNAAIAAYQRAVASNPSDLEARWKLLRAMRFKGAYVATSNDEKKQIYGAAKKSGEDALAVVNRQLAARGVKANASEKTVAEAARAIPGAAQVFLYDAINWGEWALAYGKLAAAREGAADRIKRQATIAYLVDPQLEGGAAPRVLGRLHAETPKIPFLTGWVSQKESLRFLNESLKIDPSNKLTIVFLAEALVASDPAAKARAVQMLRSAASLPIEPEFEVEQEAAAVDARALLKKWGM